MHEQFEYGRYSFEVLEMDARRILKVKVQVNDVSSEDDGKE